MFCINSYPYALYWFLKIMAFKRKKKKVKTNPFKIAHNVILIGTTASTCFKHILN